MSDAARRRPYPFGSISRPAYIPHADYCLVLEATRFAGNFRRTQIKTNRDGFGRIRRASRGWIGKD